MTYWVHSGWQEGKKTPRGGFGKWWSFAEWEMQFVRLLMALSTLWRDKVRLKSSIFRFCFLTSSCIVSEETRPVWMFLLFGWRVLWMDIDTSAHTLPHSESHWMPFSWWEHPFSLLYPPLLTKARTVKTVVFPGVMCGCEGWTIKRAEHWRIDALNCGVGEDSWESLGLQKDPTSPS